MRFSPSKNEIRTVQKLRFVPYVTYWQSQATSVGRGDINQTSFLEIRDSLLGNWLLPNTYFLSYFKCAWVLMSLHTMIAMCIAATVINLAVSTKAPLHVFCMRVCAARHYDEIKTGHQSHTSTSDFQDARTFLIQVWLLFQNISYVANFLVIFLHV